MGSGADAPPVSLATGRFERFARVDWWDQQRLRDAKVMVVGAGALGNEVVKNLSLVGIGHLAVADMDRIEESNLTRSALFSAADEGQFKADVLCRSARHLWPDIEATALVGNMQIRGLGGTFLCQCLRVMCGPKVHWQSQCHSGRRHILTAAVP